MISIFFRVGVGVGGGSDKSFKFKTVKSICNFKIMPNGKLIGDV